MFFKSDNAGPVHPQVMDALVQANEGYASPYGEDTLMDEVRQQIRDVFEAPDAAVYLVATGTAANSIALSCLAQPFETVFCSAVAHIHEDECNAPEFFSGGAKLTLVPVDADKMNADALRKTILNEETRGVHGPQRGAVSITQVAERGSVYSLDELASLCNTAKEFDLPVHLDGARFANALVRLGCTPAEMTWKLGVDAVSFGGTKNGLMGVEAVVLFDPNKAWEFELRRKRGAHLFSKHRYLSAQMNAYLKDDLWLTSARAANDNLSKLVDGLRGIEGVQLLTEPHANVAFIYMPRKIHRRVMDAGAVYYLMDGTLDDGPEDAPILGRLVCDWSVPSENIAKFIAAARG